MFNKSDMIFFLTYVQRQRTDSWLPRDRWRGAGTDWKWEKSSRKGLKSCMRKLLIEKDIIILFVETVSQYMHFKTNKKYILNTCSLLYKYTLIKIFFKV